MKISTLNNSKKTNFVGKINDFFPALMCLIFSSIFVIYLNFSPAGKNELAVIFPLGMTQEESFLKTISSGAYATGTGGIDNIILFRIDQSQDVDEVIRKLYQNNAIVVINGIGSAGCFS